MEGEAVCVFGEEVIHCSASLLEGLVYFGLNEIYVYNFIFWECLYSILLDEWVVCCRAGREVGWVCYVDGEVEYME